MACSVHWRCVLAMCVTVSILILWGAIRLGGAGLFWAVFSPFLCVFHENVTATRLYLLDPPVYLAPQSSGVHGPGEHISLVFFVEIFCLNFPFKRVNTFLKHYNSIQITNYKYI